MRTAAFIIYTLSSLCEIQACLGLCIKMGQTSCVQCSLCGPDRHQRSTFRGRGPFLLQLGSVNGAAGLWAHTPPSISRKLCWLKNRLLHISWGRCQALLVKVWEGDVSGKRLSLIEVWREVNRTDLGLICVVNSRVFASAGLREITWACLCHPRLFLELV